MKKFISVLAILLLFIKGFSQERKVFVIIEGSGAAGITTSPTKSQDFMNSKFELNLTPLFRVSDNFLLGPGFGYSKSKFETEYIRGFFSKRTYSISANSIFLRSRYNFKSDKVATTYFQSDIGIYNRDLATSFIRLGFGVQIYDRVILGTYYEAFNNPTIRSGSVGGTLGIVL